MKNLIDRETATRRLTNRWHEQCREYALFATKIPLSVYVAANLPTVQRLGILLAYDKGHP